MSEYSRFSYKEMSKNALWHLPLIEIDAMIAGVWRMPNLTHELAMRVIAKRHQILI